MPVILRPELEEDWLDLNFGPEAALTMLRPYNAKQMEEIIVDKRVGNVAYDSPQLIEVVDEKGKDQLDLFGE